MSLFVGGSPYSTGLSLLPSCSLLLLRVRQPPIVANFQTNRAKQGKNEFLFGGRWCFLGILGDKKVQNLNIFLKCGKKNGWRCGRLPAFWRAHWVQRLAGLRGFGAAGCWRLSSGGAFRPFGRFLALRLVRWLEI